MLSRPTSPGQEPHHPAHPLASLFLNLPQDRWGSQSCITSPQLRRAGPWERWSVNVGQKGPIHGPWSFVSLKREGESGGLKNGSQGGSQGYLKEMLCRAPIQGHSLRAAMRLFQFRAPEELQTGRLSNYQIRNGPELSKAQRTTQKASLLRVATPGTVTYHSPREISLPLVISKPPLFIMAL